MRDFRQFERELRLPLSRDLNRSSTGSIDAVVSGRLPWSCPTVRTIALSEGQVAQVLDSQDQPVALRMAVQSLIIK